VNLTAADFAKLLSSGIPAELAAQAQLYRVESREGGELIGRDGSADYTGLAFPYFWPGETKPREYRLRRDRPELEHKEGKPRERAKYLSPPGRGNLLYFVPGSSPEWLNDTRMPAVITEGEKKTLALWVCAWEGCGDSAEIPGFLPMGLPGVWNWRGTVSKTNGPDGERRDVKGPIPDLGRIAWKDRNVTILFDTNVGDNESVQAARRELTNELRKRGADVYWFAWPDDTPAGVNGIDDLVGLWGAPKVRRLITERVRPVKLTTSEYQSSAREFSIVGDDHYRLVVPALGITFDVDRLRRERHELIGELAVKCELPGARTVVGSSLSIADFNLSSARARSDRAKMLTERAQTKSLDWVGFVEEFCQRVLQADRNGQSAVVLGKPDPSYRQDSMIDIDRLVIPRHHPTILFGDGGTCKSYIALRLLGKLAEVGVPVIYIDWEFDRQEHEYRLSRLFPDGLPNIWYVRCQRPLIHEVDSLQRIVRQNGIQFAVYDSAAYACAGPPESAEAASAYFRAVRQIGVGSLHIAHVNKSEQGDKKPFGSVFWHNSARSTWFVAADEHSENPKRVALFNRKVNLDKLLRPVSYAIRFTDFETTEFELADVADSPDLSGKLSVRERMVHMLKRGAFGYEQIADEIGADPETVGRTARRYRKQFVILPGGKVRLLSGPDSPADSPGQSARGGGGHTGVSI
jgi:hypothetical protein